MFEVQGEQYRRQSGIEAFLFTPFVTLQQQLEWERYAQEHQSGWLEWGRDFNLRNTEIAIRQPYLPGNVYPIIYQYDKNDYTTKVPAIATNATTTDDEDEESLYAPIWLVRNEMLCCAVHSRLLWHAFLILFPSPHTTDFTSTLSSRLCQLQHVVGTSLGTHSRIVE
jgi:hypothetical protein